nr:hypothetical protein B0A51_02111 [Rachicladosporium sp. CCFEE 5018]
MQVTTVTFVVLCCSIGAALLHPQQRLHWPQQTVTTNALHWVPGRNNATYGKTPAKDQLFTIEFLDVAPFPIVSGELYYIYLYGNFWPQWTPGLSEAELAKATLSITFSIIYADGSQDHSKPWTIPLESKMLDRFRHIGICNETGHATDHMSLRANDIVADGYIPKQFVVSGNWTMEGDARLPDGTCLFDFAMTQWVDGNLQRHV